MQGLSGHDPGSFSQNHKGLSHHVEIFPVITKVSPSVGSAAGGTVVTIKGLGFDAAKILDNVITVDSLPCTVTSVKATEIKCVTPPVPKLDSKLDVGQRGCLGKSCQRLSGRGMEVRTLKTPNSGKSLQSHVGISRKFSKRFVPNPVVYKGRAGQSDHARLKPHDGLIAVDLRDEFFLSSGMQYDVQFTYKTDGTFDTCGASQSGIRPLNAKGEAADTTVFAKQVVFEGAGQTKKCYTKARQLKNPGGEPDENRCKKLCMEDNDCAFVRMVVYKDIAAAAECWTFTQRACKEKEVQSISKLYALQRNSAPFPPATKQIFTHMTADSFPSSVSDEKHKVWRDTSGHNRHATFAGAVSAVDDAFPSGLKLKTVKVVTCLCYMHAVIDTSMYVTI